MMSKSYKKRSSGTSGLRLAFLGLLALIFTPAILTAVAAQPKPRAIKAPRLEAKPTIPNANRSRGDRVILERANTLKKNESDSFMIVSGNVEFSKGPMLMYCDSAHYYTGSGSMDAFGNVRMEQGDTLFVYGDELNYNGAEEIAYLFAHTNTRPVRLINRDVKLETDVFTYDLYSDIGYYTTGGTLTDNKNHLESIEGEYRPSSKEANFYSMVHLTSMQEKDSLDIFTDTLLYNTVTHEAEFFSPTQIINHDGIIYSTEGRYNTNTEVADLYARSKVKMNRGTTLEGDTLFYDRQGGRGEAFGNMVLTDSVRQSTLQGDYGYYDEIADSAYVTGRAVAMEYSRGDTLYMHGRYITSVLRIDQLSNVTDTSYTEYADTMHVVNAWPRVRFWRVDMQGIADSLAFVERDSTLYLHRHPVVWNENQQIFGNVILVHLNDSTIDRALLPDFAFSAQEIEPDFYNQLTGKRMEAFFDGGKLRQVDVSGSVQAIYFPEESDSTINKMVSTESSFLTAWMKDNAIERMKMWPQTNGTATPLYLAKRSMLWLPQFEWFDDMRPRSPEDIFNVPPRMEEIMSTAVLSTWTPEDDDPQAALRRKRTQRNKTAPAEETTTEPDPDSGTEITESAEQ